jgi:uncharacterized YccA/Bax inhibitor family protein
LANPVLTRGFQNRADQSYPQQYGQPYQQGPQGQYGSYPQAPYQQQGPQGPYGSQPSPYGAPWQTPQPAGARMTLDDVITKTSITIGILVLVAAAAWVLLPVQLGMAAAGVGAIGAFITTIALAFRRKVGPVAAIAVAVFEGLFVGGITRLFEMYYPGIAMQAVLGTFVAAGATLAVFKYAGFRLTGKMRKILMIALVGMMAAGLVNLVMYFLGAGSPLVAGVTGPVGVLPWLFASLGVVVAVFSLVDDFQMIEEGVAMGAPASESWRAAFGLTVTMVYLYINILRILSYLRR